MIALTKTMNPDWDYVQLEPELAVVDRVGIAGQHSQRRWEYALALRAINLWRTTDRRTRRPRLYDIGGAGSSFVRMPEAVGLVVDPAVPRTTPVHLKLDLHTFRASQPTPRADIVTCLSVLEHVADWTTFLLDLVALVQPCGLLVLTMDCWDGTGPDTAHFSHMRERIYSMADWQALAATLESLEMQRFGEADWTYHGHQLYGSYSFCSLVFTKKESA